MSTNLKYKQATNVTRRTWDLEDYEKKAKARSEGPVRQPKAGEKRPLQEDEEVKEEFIPAPSGAAGPERSKRAFLKARRDKVDIDSKIGSTEIVSTEAVATTKVGNDVAGSVKDGVTKTGVGWHCKVCDCFLKDSHTYLDHINGRKHQRNLGYSMRVEKSSKEQLKERLSQLAKEKETTSENPEVEAPSFEDVVKAKDDEALRRKEERARKREERIKRLKQEQSADEEEEEEEINPDMAAMMGFAGFGGGNKSR